MDLPSILLLFRNKFNQFNTKGAQMLDFINYTTLKIICDSTFGVKTSRLCQIYTGPILYSKSMEFQNFYQFYHYRGNVTHLGGLKKCNEVKFWSEHKEIYFSFSQ